MEANGKQKRRGRVPGPETERTTILLEPDLIEWGKNKRGGLSELVRNLLREAYQSEQESGQARA